MHMTDALLSPTVGGIMWALTGAATIYCSRRIRSDLDDRKIPLMGVMGAFVFAAQMVNFAIPGTGSSGHLGGGLLLAVILGPYGAFLTMVSVLTVQALFFADGGLLALGANILNLGFAPCFIAYPLIYKTLSGRKTTPGRLLLAAITAAVTGLQLGSLGVVAETYLSGMISLSFSSFLLLMQTVHLPIGLIEGLATAGIISFLVKARPEILEGDRSDRLRAGLPPAKVLAVLAVATLLTGGILTWFASEKPDGLEWSLDKSSFNKGIVHDPEEAQSPTRSLLDKIALLPGYDFRSSQQTANTNTRGNTGAPLSALLGGGIVMLALLLTGFLLRRKGKTDGR